jgi:hypothetical protein
MSQNDRFYAAKIAEQKRNRSAGRPLHGQFAELMTFVTTCEHEWESRLRTERTRNGEWS